MTKWVSDWLLGSDINIEIYFASDVGWCASVNAVEVVQGCQTEDEAKERAGDYIVAKLNESRNRSQGVI